MQSPDQNAGQDCKEDSRGECDASRVWLKTDQVRLRKTEKRETSNTFRSTVLDRGSPKEFVSSLYCLATRFVHPEYGRKPESSGEPFWTSQRGIDCRRRQATA